MEASRRPASGQGGSVLSMDAVLSQYPPEEFILLLPPNSKTLLDARPMWRIDVSVVKIDPDDKQLVYPIKKTWDKTTKPWTEIVERVALQRPALDLIGAAAEIQTLAKRTDDRTNPLYAEYTAMGVMTTPSGAIRGQARSAEWDGDLERDKIQLEAERYVARAIADGWKGFDEASRARLVADRVATEWLREREFGKRKTESKAANRALRAILAMPPSYAYDELKKKAFAIAKFVFSPDLDDPQIKLLVVQDGLNAQKMLFGGALAQAVGGDLAPQLTAGAAGPAPLAIAAGGGAPDDDDDTLDMFDGASATHGAPAAPPPATSPARDQAAPPNSEPLPEPLPVAEEEPTPEQVVAKMRDAKAQPHLDNIWKKYSGRARAEGWIDAMTEAYRGRASALRGGASR